jgi:hypothetical protein
VSVLSACCKNAHRPKGPEVFKPGARVTLECPAEASSQGPISIEVKLDADARTYWDNQGILDDALEILLVRRDRPGMLAVAKADRATIALPSPSLPGRPSDKELSRDVSRVTEQKSYDVLAYGRRHEGAAEYSVIASFADAWAGPTRLKVVDSAGDLAPEVGEASLAPAAQQAEPVPASHGVIARIGEIAGRPAIIGAFRTHTPKSKAAMLFGSIVMARLRPTGGISQLQFRPVHRRERNDLVGGFAVPVSALAPAPDFGRYVLFAFVGDEDTAASVVQIPP